MLRIAILVLGFVLVLSGGAATSAGRKCLDITGDYRCPSGLEVYLSFSEGGDGNFILDMELDSGKYYQYLADDKLNIRSDGSDQQYIASCRRKFFRLALPTTKFPVTEEDKEKHKGKDIYKVEEYSWAYRGALLGVDIYYAEIPEGNMNDVKRLENKRFFTCKRM